MAREQETMIVPFLDLVTSIVSPGAAAGMLADHKFVLGGMMIGVCVTSIIRYAGQALK